MLRIVWSGICQYPEYANTPISIALLCVIVKSDDKADRENYTNNVGLGHADQFLIIFSQSKQIQNNAKGRS